MFLPVLPGEAVIDTRPTAAEAPLSGPKTYYFTGVVLFVGVLLRFLYLGADPHYYSWIGYITDEGRWIGNARSLYFDGVLSKTGDVLHFLIAPIFQLANYTIFLLAGPSRTNSLIFTAICGSTILILFWFILRDKVTPPALLLSVTFLALQPDLLMLSRVAIPEIPVMLFQLFAFSVVASTRDSRWKTLMAGFLVILGIATKLTMVLFLPVAAVIILTRHYTQPGLERTHPRWRELGLFGIGCGIPALIVGIGLLHSLTETGLLTLVGNLKVITSFISFSSPYSVISFFFDSPLALTINLWALGLWISCLAWISVDRNSIHAWCRGYVVSAAIWFVFYLVMMQLLSYFPLRYKVHLLIPMSVLLAVGISVCQQVGLEKIIQSFAQSRGGARLCRSGLLTLPTAAFFSPLLVSAVAVTGVGVERLSMKLACLATTLVGLTFAAYYLHSNQRIVRILLVFPLTAGCVYLVLSAISPGWSLGSAMDAMQDLVRWFFFLTAAVWGSFVLAGNTGSRLRLRQGVPWITVIAICYMPVSILGVLPQYAAPHYTIRNASRDLDTVLAGYSSIFVHRAEGLFNDNSVRFRSDMDWESARPQAVVSFENYINARPLENLLKREYVPLKRYELYVSPEYYRLNGGDAQTPDLGAIVTVYVRSETATNANPD
jgi:hypothetical protein